MGLCLPPHTHTPPPSEAAWVAGKRGHHERGGGGGAVTAVVARERRDARQGCPVSTCDWLACELRAACGSKEDLVHQVEVQGSIAASFVGKISTEETVDHRAAMMTLMGAIQTTSASSGLTQPAGDHFACFSIINHVFIQNLLFHSELFRLKLRVGKMRPSLQRV